MYKRRQENEASDQGAALALVLFFIILTSLWLMAVITLTQSSSSAIVQNVEQSNIRSEIITEGIKRSLQKLTPDPNTLDPDNPSNVNKRLGTFINGCDTSDFTFTFQIAGREIQVNCDQAENSGYEYESNSLYLMGPYFSGSGWNLNKYCADADKCIVGQDGGLSVGGASGGGFDGGCVSAGQKRFLIYGGMVDLFGRWFDETKNSREEGLNLCERMEMKSSDQSPSSPVKVVLPVAGSSLCPEQTTPLVNISPIFNKDCNSRTLMRWGGKDSGVGKVTPLTEDSLNKIYEIEKSSVVVDSEMGKTLIKDSGEILSFGGSSGTIRISAPQRWLHSDIELEVFPSSGGNSSRIRTSPTGTTSSDSIYNFTLVSGSLNTGPTGRIFTDRVTFDPKSPNCASNYIQDPSNSRRYINVLPGVMTRIELEILNPLLGPGSGCGNGTAAKGPAIVMRSAEVWTGGNLDQRVISGVFRVNPITSGGVNSKSRTSSNSIIINNGEVVLFGGDPIQQFPTQAAILKVPSYTGEIVNQCPILNGYQDNDPSTLYKGVRLEFSGYSYIHVQKGKLILCGDIKEISGTSERQVQPVIVAPRRQSYESFTGQIIWGQQDSSASNSSDCSSEHDDCPIIELEQGSNSNEDCATITNCIYIKGKVIAPGSWIDLDLNGQTVATFEGGIMARAMSVSTTASGPPGRKIEGGQWRYLSDRIVQLWFTEKSSNRSLGTVQIKIIDTKSRLAVGYKVLSWRAGW